MRYGAHSFIFTDNWSDQSLPLLDTARELGLDCFEIGVGDDVHFSPSLTRSHAEALGLELIISPGGYWPRECDLSANDTDQRTRALDWHKRMVNLGGELGATAYTGALYGHPGVLSHHPPRDAEQCWIAEGLRLLAEYSLPYGVQIVIEPMSHFRTHVANTAEQALQLLERAAHPNLQVLLDTYHLMTETRDFAREFERTRGHLWGLHACENDRGAPGGGLVPWEQVFSALQSMSFDGYVILESYNSSIGDPPGSFAYRRGMLHDVCADARTFVTTGMGFVRRNMERYLTPNPQEGPT